MTPERFLQLILYVVAVVVVVLVAVWLVNRLDSDTPNLILGGLIQ